MGVTVVHVNVGESAAEENNGESILNLTKVHLNYILSIYEILKEVDTVSSCSIANTLGASKPSVSVMRSTLMTRHLRVKERYVKVYLTNDGYAIAMNLEKNIKILEERIPNIKISFTDYEIRKLAAIAAVSLPGEDFQS